jgi:hypothetical protein
MSYSLGDVPHLIDKGKYVSALKILYESNHPLSYDLFPHRSKDKIMSELSANIELSDAQLQRLRNFIHQHLLENVIGASGLAILSGISFILGILGLYRLFTTPLLPLNGEIAVSCCGGVVTFPIFLFALASCRDAYLTSKSENFGLWQ